MFPKPRSKGAFLLFYLIIGYLLLPVPTLEAADSRIEKLANINQQAGSVCISGDLIVFSQKVGVQNLPAYYSIASGERAVINPAVSLINMDPVKISSGVALYRSKNKDKLWITNLEQLEHWGLAKGESRVIANSSMSSYFAISGNKIVYLEEDGLRKNCWLINESGETLSLAAHIKASDLRLYQDENYAVASWLNKDTGLINYCDLLGDLAIKSLAGSKADAQYSLWRDRVAYKNLDNGKYYLQNLEPAAVAQEITLSGATGPLCLYGDRLFYAASNKIKCYNPETSSEMELINHENPIISLHSNGFDLVWQDSLHYPYWRAATGEISLSGQSDIKVGQAIQLMAKAVFKNNFQEDVSQTAVWSSSNNGVAEVAAGICSGKAAGSVTIKAVYESVYAETAFMVKALESLVINPPTASLEPGNTLQLTAAGIYSDNSVEDMTSLVTWECNTAGSVSAQGLFCAGEAGIAEVKASLGLISSTIHIEVTAVSPVEPPPGEAEDEEAVDPPPEIVPESPAPAIPPEESPPDNPPVITPPAPVIVHRHADDESLYINNTPVYKNSSIFLALQKAPPYSTVEVEVKMLGSCPEAIEFILERAASEIMSNDQKTLQIKSPICVLEFSPAFAAGYRSEDLKFRMSREHSNSAPREYGACLLDSISDVYMLLVANEKDQAIKEFGVPISVTLFNNPGKIADLEKTGILGHRLSDPEWNCIKSKLLAGETRKINCLFPGIFAVMEFNRSFSDLNDHWARKDIEILAAQQIFPDAGDNNFEPDHNITRGEFADLLVRVLDLNTEAPVPNGDEKEKGYDSSLAAAVQAGIVQGDAEGDMALQREISREEMAVMLFRALLRQGIPVKAYSGVKPLISDREKISAWASMEVENLESLGIMAGRPDNSFAPREYGTRAEAAAVIRRLIHCLE